MTTPTYHRPRLHATTRRRRRLAALAVTALGLAACGGSDVATDTSPAPSETETEATATDATTTEAPNTTDAPTTDAPVTTDAPTTEAPAATEPPSVTEPEPPATEPPVTEPEPPAAEPATSCVPPNASDATQPAGAVASFDPDALEIPAGVAVDGSGNVYMSLGPLGQIVRFAAGSGDYEVVATVPDWDLAPEEYAVEDYGIEGVAVDPDGNIYAAVDSQTLGGVWRFDCATGESERFEGTEAMLFANKLVFDDQGNLYATDSWSGTENDEARGAIWKITPDGDAEKWIDSADLGGTGVFGLANPIGANGIGFYDGRLYVNVTEKTSVVTIEVLEDGSAGTIEPYVTTEFGVVNVGMALDAEGRVYVADPSRQGIARIDADGTIVDVAVGVDAGFNDPIDLAFGTDGTALTLYVTNAARVGAVPGGPSPSLLAVDVDTPGLPQP